MQISPRSLLSFLVLVLASACAHEQTFAPVERYGLFELHMPREHGAGIAQADRTAPAEIPVFAEIRTPSGALQRIEGFGTDHSIDVRFSPYETGTYHVSVRSGRAEVIRGELDVRPGKRKPPVRRDPEVPQRLIRGDGSTFYALGENRINIYDPSWQDGASIPDYIERMARDGMTTLRVFIFTDIECEECQERAALGTLERTLGRYDDSVAKRFDVIMNSAEANDIQVIITLFAIGFTEDETWKSWADNPYNSVRGGPVDKPKDFFTDGKARLFAEKKLRYVLARWGYSSSLLAIDLLNEPEWDGPIAEEVWVPWARELAESVKDYNPNHHMITAGPVGPVRSWYEAPENAITQFHLYGAPYYEPQKLADEMTKRVRENWSTERPVIVGEFAYGGEDKTTYEHTHVGIWSAIFSGAGVLAHSAPPFNVDSDEPMTPERAKHFRVLRDFLDAMADDVVWHGPRFDAETVSDVRAWELVTEDGASGAVWLLGAGEKKSEVVLPQLRGDYVVTWVNDITGETISEHNASAGESGLKVSAPAFKHHVAMRFQRR